MKGELWRTCVFLVFVFDFLAAKSENGRLKHWSRVRYGCMQLCELDLHEYAYYVNVGFSDSHIMKAMA